MHGGLDLDHLWNRMAQNSLEGTILLAGLNSGCVKEIEMVEMMIERRFVMNILNEVLEVDPSTEAGAKPALK